MGAGESIIFIHGFPETLQTWRYVILPISDFFQTIALDLKGFGYSDKPEGDYSPWGMADFVKDFMEALKIDKAHIVATDTGLTIASAFALRYPEKLKRLILMAGTNYSEGMTAPEVKLLSIKPFGEMILWLLGSLAIKIGLRKGFYKKEPISNDIFNEYYQPFKNSATRRCALELFRSFDKAVPELSKEVNKISASTLILWAQYERFFSLQVAKKLNNDIKNSQLKIIPDSGHFIQEENPGEVVKAILSFLRN